MTVAASQGVVGWGAQVDADTLATTWYRHKASRVDMGAIQDIRQFPPEIGGGFHPTGAYKRMAAGGGQVVMAPRLQETIGWLLYGGVGDLSTISDTPEATMYRHIFNPPAAFSDMKWMSARKEIPGSSGDTNNSGEILKAARVAGLRFSTAAGGLVQCGASFLAKEPSFTRNGVDSWTWNNSYEDEEGVPTAAASDQVKVDGSDQKATAITLDIANSYTTPDEELIIGGYYPDDLILQQQVFSVRWTYKWNDPELYKRILTGTNTESGGDIDWSPIVHTAPFLATLKTPADATGMSNPWAIRFQAPEMTWQAEGSPVLVGGGWLALNYRGVAQEQSSGDTFQVELENLTSSYTWPS